MTPTFSSLRRLAFCSGLGFLAAAIVFLCTAPFAQEEATAHAGALAHANTLEDVESPLADESPSPDEGPQQAVAQNQVPPSAVTETSPDSSGVQILRPYRMPETVNWPLVFQRSFVLIWLVSVGAVVGSFLNVVVYRLPRGKSLLRPGSRCPVCDHAIRLSDNIPVLGWLRLRGKCRDCQTPISGRYPLVEALTAIVFLATAWTEVTAGGENLPVIRRLGAPVLYTMAQRDFSLAATVAYHVLFASCAWTAAIMEWDRVFVPRKLAGFALTIGALVPVGWAVVRPVPGLPAETAWLAQGWLQGLMDGLLGIAAGLALGIAYWDKPPVGASTANPRNVLVWVGLFLGWQAVLVIGLGARLLTLVNRTLEAAQVLPGVLPGCVWLLGGSLLSISRWNKIVQELPVLTDRSSLVFVAAAVGMAGALGCWGRILPALPKAENPWDPARGAPVLNVAGVDSAAEADPAETLQTEAAVPGESPGRSDRPDNNGTAM